MKLRLLLLTLIGFTFSAFAQEYPLVTIQDIQYIHPDSLAQAPYDYPSELNGDTVRVQGIVTYGPFYDDQVREVHTFGGTGDGDVTGFTWGAISVIIQDTSNPAWGGMLVRFTGDAGAAAAFESIFQGDYIEVTGEVSEYFTTTQLNIWSFSANNILAFSGDVDMPEYAEITLDSLAVTGGTDPVYAGEKWEFVRVQVNNVTATDAVSLGDGSFGIYDANGTQVYTGNKGARYRAQIYDVPDPGTQLTYIRGFIETRNNLGDGWHILNPVYEDDIELGTVVPPSIADVRRDIDVVGLNTAVEISAVIKDKDGDIEEASVYYSTNGTNYTQVDMSPVNDTTLAATIPGQSDSTLVSYYVEAIDDEGNRSLNPTDTSESPYFYYTLGRDLQIQDIQKTPFGSGSGAYTYADVTVTGVVTSDTTQISNFVVIQNGQGPWSGIRIIGTEAIKLQNGDSVTVSGTVYEDYGYTVISGLSDPSDVINHGQANVMIEPEVLTTSEIATMSSGTLPAEQWESVLITYENVTVTDLNADGAEGPVSNNYGEILVADGSSSPTRVELQDGNHTYNNEWTAGLSGTELKVNDTFTSLTGILYFSFSNYKLIPRTDADFVGYTTGVEVYDSAIPTDYAVSQNYPNPFNPSTTIRFSIPEAGNVSLWVYNVLGQQVAELINEQKNAGTYNVTFDAARLSSGIYFYQIQSGKYSETRKMILLK